MLIDSKNGIYTLETSYYYIGHFSKFVRPGAIRIGSSSFTSKLDVCAFINPDHERVLIVMNAEEEEIPVFVRCEGEIAYFKIAGHSIITAAF